MSNYGFTNDQGEPIMDGAAYRFEQQLDMDSMADYYADRFYDNDGGVLDPSECGHGSLDYPEGEIWCYDCDSQVGIWESRDADGWPIPTFFDQSGHPDAEPMEDQWLDSHMEDRLTTMFE